MGAPRLEKPEVRPRRRLLRHRLLSPTCALGITGVLAAATGCASPVHFTAKAAPAASTTATARVSGASAAEPAASGAGPVAEPTVESRTPPPGVPGAPEVTHVRRGGKPPRPTEAAPPVPLSGTIAYPKGITLRIVGMTRAVETGEGPGMFPGRPFVVFDFELVNRSKVPLDVSRAVVTALAGTPQVVVPPVYVGETPMTDFSGTVPPRGKVSARYAFAIDPATAGKVTLFVDLDEAHRPAAFSGDLARLA